MIVTFQCLIFKKVSLLINQLHLFLMKNKKNMKSSGVKCVKWFKHLCSNDLFL